MTPLYEADADEEQDTADENQDEIYESGWGRSLIFEDDAVDTERRGDSADFYEECRKGEGTLDYECIYLFHIQIFNCLVFPLLSLAAGSPHS